MSGLQAVGVLLIRIWAAETIFLSIAQLSLQIIFLLQSPTAEWLSDQGSSTAFGAVWLVAGFLAWFFALPLVKLALPSGSSTGELTFTMDTDGFVRAGCLLIGIFYIIEVTPQLIADLMNAFDQMQSNMERGGKVSPMFYVGVIAGVIKMALALLVIVGPSRIVRGFWALRTAGLSRVESEN